MFSAQANTLISIFFGGDFDITVRFRYEQTKRCIYIGRTSQMLLRNDRPISPQETTLMHSMVPMVYPWDGLATFNKPGARSSPSACRISLGGWSIILPVPLSPLKPSQLISSKCLMLNAKLTIKFSKPINLQHPINPSSTQASACNLLYNGSGNDINSYLTF